MLREIMLLVKVLQFVWDAVQTFAITDAGVAALEEIAKEEQAIEAENPSLEASPAGEILTGTLEAARAARRGK